LPIGSGYRKSKCCVFNGYGYKVLSGILEKENNKELFVGEKFIEIKKTFSKRKTEIRIIIKPSQ